MNKNFLFKMLCYVIFCHSAMFSTKVFACNCCLEGIINKELYNIRNFEELEKEYKTLINENLNTYNQGGNKKTININSKELTIEKKCTKIHYGADEEDKVFLTLSYSGLKEYRAVCIKIKTQMIMYIKNLLCITKEMEKIFLKFQDVLIVRNCLKNTIF